MKNELRWIGTVWSTVRKLLFVCCVLGPTTVVSAQETRVPDLASRPLREAVAALPALYWIQLEPLAESGKVRVSLELEAPDSTSWILKADARAPASARAKLGVREVLADGVQAGFSLPVLPGALGELEFTLEPRTPNRVETTRLSSKAPSFTVVVPLPTEASGTSTTRLLIPELQALKHESAERTWWAWDLVLSSAGATDLSVRDAAGRVIRAWPPGYVMGGRVTVLWDGLDDSGNSAAAGPFFLQADAGGGVPLTQSPPGKPVI